MKNTKTNREIFLKNISLSQKDTERVYDAYMFSKYGHKGQERDQGGRYFEHPRAVADIITLELGIKTDWKIIATALLHDILEDTWLFSEKCLSRNFGKTVALWIQLLTKDKEWTEKGDIEYIERIRDCGIWQVILVKLCDRLHNLRTLRGCSIKKQKRVLVFTKAYYYEIISVFQTIIPKKYQEVSEKLEKLILIEIKKLESS